MHRIYNLLCVPPSFWTGFASVLDITGQRRVRPVVTGPEADRLAVEEAWRDVGNAMREAMFGFEVQMELDGSHAPQAKACAS